MAAEVDICNLAILRQGGKQFISALTDPSTAAKACALAFPAGRDQVLQAFPWPFCKKSATLALESYTRPGWQYAYALPDDCLAPRSIFNGYREGAPIYQTFGMPVQVGQTLQAASLAAGQPIAFEVQQSDDGASRILCTDQPEAVLVYTAYSTNSALWPPNFRDALAWKLASELQLGIPVKPDVFRLFDAKYKEVLMLAAAEQLRGQRDDVAPDSDIITFR